MTRDELVAHCRRKIAQCERWAAIKREEISNDKVYDEHRFVLTLLTQPGENELSLADAILFAEQGNLQAHKYLEKIVSQKPFINEPCVSKQAYHEDMVAVLKKIKAEIEEDYSHTFNDGCINKDHVLSVIDKYMEKEEDKK